MVFCDRIRRELLDNEGTKSFTVTGGDVTGLTEVLAWIKQCVAEGSIVKYKDVSMPTAPFPLEGSNSNTPDSVPFFGLGLKTNLPSSSATHPTSSPLMPTS